MTNTQIDELITVISVGCPLQTALEICNATQAEYEAERRSNPEFVRRLNRASGNAEFEQLRVIQKKGKDDNEWRASVWWLERCRPERYDGRPIKTISLDEFEAFRADVASLLHSQIHDPDDRRRLVAELRRLTSRVLPTDSPSSDGEEVTATDTHGSNTDASESFCEGEPQQSEGSRSAPWEEVDHSE